MKKPSPKQFTGLLLTVFAVVFLYLARNSLVLADTRIANFLYLFRNDTLLRFFYFVTLFAESAVIVVLSVLFSVFLWIYRQHLYLFSLWFALIVGEGLTFLGKHILQRERPAVFLRAVAEDSFSFPSGHATTAVLFYGFLAYLLIRSYASLKIRTLTLSLLALIVALIDFSRLYLGVHYLSDVIAGNLVGFAALILTVGITEWLIVRRPELAPDKTKFSQILLVLLGAVVAVSAIYFFVR